MKRIISFVLCLSMLVSMLPVSVFASDVEESITVETTPVTEVLPETEATVLTEAAPETETAAVTEAAVTAAETTETTVPAEESTEPVTVPDETVPQETEAEIVETLTYIPETDLPDNDELFAAYAEHALYDSCVCALGTAAGEMLSGNAKVAYKALVPVIREIANGQRSSSVISVGNYGNTDVEAQFSSSGFTYDELVSLLNALLADLPCELYWFDKVSGIGASTASRNGKMRITFKLPVAANYSASGNTGSYALNTEKTQAVPNAVAKAAEIVQAYQNASDYEKLVGYKNEICDLASYNSAAANSMNFSSNSDPWQLIYVFDGLQSTKVVCEGYSKAFQYLCDLSSFQNEVICYQVSGTMKSSSGSGSHMWNIVGINGKYYLADITNSDVGTVGANGKLFLAGGTAAGDNSYTVGGVKFTYNQATQNLWGTGDDSILTLESEKYDPNVVAQSPSNGVTTMTGDELEAALAGVSGAYELNCPVTVSSAITIPGSIYLQLAGSDAYMTIQSGGSVTVSTFLSVADGASVMVEDGGTLTLDGTLSVGQGSNVDVYGTLEHNAKLECAGSVKVYGSYQATSDAYITVMEGGNVITETPDPPTNAEELVNAVNLGIAVTVWESITITEDTVLSSGSLLSFADFAKLTVSNGATLTLNCPTMINGAQLIVEEGATLISNVDLAINDPMGNGGCAVFDGTFVNNGVFWINTGSTVSAWGIIENSGAFHVGCGESGQLDLFGTMNTTGYLAVHPGGTMITYNGSTLNIQNIENVGCGYLDNSGKCWINGAIHLDGLLSSGSGKDEDGNLLVDNGYAENAPIIQLSNSAILNGAKESNIFVNQGGCLQCFGPLTTAGALTVEKNGVLWVDDTVTVQGPAPLTALGNLHINSNADWSGGQGKLNIETEANVNGYLAVHNGGILNVTKAATLNILNDENGCGYLDNRGYAGIHGTMNLDGLCSTGASQDQEGNVTGDHANIEITGSLVGSDTSSLGIGKEGSISCYGPVTTTGEVNIEQGGTLWVDNTVTLNRPGALRNNGWLHIDFFDEFASADGVLNLNTEAHVNGYLHVCDGGTLNGGKDSTIGIYYIDETNCGYLDNQGAMTMDGHLYLEGLFSTGAACDQEGNVVGPAASAQFNWYIDTTETAGFFVGTDGTVSLYGLNNAGEFQVDEGGTLVLQKDVGLNNNGGLISAAAGDLQSEGFYCVMNHMTDGSFGTVEGFPAESTYLHCYPTSVADIKTLAAEFETGKYVDGTIQIESDFVIDEDITLPEGTGIMLIVTEGDAKPTLTIPADVTVTNNGGIYVFENTTLMADGEILGNDPINKGGTITGASVDPQARFEHLLNDSDYPVLTFDLVLERDVEINGELRVAEGVTLTIPRDITLTVNNRVEVAGSLVTKSGGKLVNNGTVANVGGTVTLAAKTYTAGNNYACVENACINGVFGKITGLAAKEQQMYMAIYTEADIQTALDLMKSMSYKCLNAQILADLTVGDLTVPANVTLGIGEMNPYTPVTVIVSGTLTVEEGAQGLFVMPESTLAVNGSASSRGRINVFGTLKLGEYASFHNQGGVFAILGKIACGEGSFVINTMVGGVLGTITGVPYAHLAADARVESVDEIYALFEQASPETYCDITVVMEKSMTLTRDLEIPEVGFINVLSRDGSPVTLTIPEEITVTNHGYIYVVRQGAELINNGYINSFGQVNAMAGGTVTLNGILDLYGDSVIDGTLVNNAMIWIDNDTSLEVAEYVGPSASFTFQSQMDIGGTCANVTGIPVEMQTLCVNVSSQSDVDAALAYSQEHGYGWTILIITDSFSLTRDLTIPENCFFLMNPTDEEGNPKPITLTIPEHITVTHKGYFEIPGDATVVIDGMWLGELPITWGGGILTGGYFEMSQSEFEQWLNSDVEDKWLNSQVTITSDLVIDRGFAIGGMGSITIAEGVHVVLNGDIWIDEGRLIVDGRLENCNYIGITAGEITINGTYEQTEWARVENFTYDYGYYDQSLQINGLDRSFQTLFFDYDDPALLSEFLADLDGYRYGTIMIRGDFTLTESIVIPENVYVNIVNDDDRTPVLTIPKLHTLINYGEIKIGYDGHLIVDGTYTGNLPILDDDTAEFTVNGKLAFGQDELEALLEKGGDVNLTVPLVLNRDLTIPDHANLIIGKGGKLAVPGGKTLYVEGQIHVNWSVDQEGNGEPGLVLESGKIVNNGLITVYNLGLFDASNGTYEQAEWAVLERIYRGNDSEIPFLAAEILGVPNSLVTIGADYPNPETVRVVSAVAASAVENGDPFREIRYNIECSMTLPEDLVIPENGYLWIGSWSKDPVTLTVPEGVTLTNRNIIEITANGKLVMEGQLEGYQPWTTGGGQYILYYSDTYTEAEFRTDIAEAAEKNQQVFLCRPMTLTENLTIPEGFCLTIGLDGQLVVPQGVTLTVDGTLQVLESVENDNAPGLLLQGGKLVNNGTVIAEGFGIIDASNGTYEQNDWAQLQRIYHDNGEDGIHPADIIGISNSHITLIGADATEGMISMLTAIADYAASIGDPFAIVKLELAGRELRLTEDLTIPNGIWLQIMDGGTLIVPNDITLTNKGNIDIQWAGTVIVENGGKILGNHPSCVDTGAEYINENTYTQTDLEDLIANNLENGYAVLSVPVTLERDLTVPADFTLIITGRDNFITIPNGVTMYNNGTIFCQMFGGILSQGGRLSNDGPIHVLNWGVVDMWNGDYIPWGNGTVYNHHYRWSDGYEEHATVEGFDPFHVVVLSGGDEDSLLHELVDFIFSVGQEGYYSGLSSEICGDMTLTGDLYWPGFATMTIPEGITVTIPEGVMLENQGTIFVYGRLIVEGTLTGNGQIQAGSPECIEGSPDSVVTVPGVALEDFTVAVTQETISLNSYTQLWIENATEYANVYSYRYRLISGDATIFGCGEYFAGPNDRVDIYNFGATSTEPIVVEVTPIIGYDENGEVYADHLTKTVTIRVVEAVADVWWNGTYFQDEIYGLGIYAGNKLTMGGMMANIATGEWLDGTVRLDIQGANEFVTIKENADGTVVISADKKLTEAVVLSITAVPVETNGLEVASYTNKLIIRPNVSKADLLLDGEAVTGKTVTFDLNQGHQDLWLDFITDPADAYGSIILDYDQTTGEATFALSYKSSNEKVATVDQWGNVHFTGATGKVKITATAALSKKVTATVTFNVVAMPQEIFPAESNAEQLIGGKAATYTVVDENDNVVNAKEVNWFLCDEWGNPVESSPYATIKSGKLTTKAVIDPYEVYLMAQLVGNENSARLAEPIRVTLYPAVTSVSILNPFGKAINNWTLLWDFADMENFEGDYYLSWSAPCDESIKEVTWKSSKPAIADILDTGLILPTGEAGTVKFTMTAVALDGKKISASVTYKFGTFTKELDLYANLPNGDRQQLLFDETDTLVINSGESITFEAYPIPETVTTPGVTWAMLTKADGTAASINNKGVLKAKSVTNPTFARVLVSSKDGYAACMINVLILPTAKVNGQIVEGLTIQDENWNYVTKSSLTLTPGTETMLYASDEVTWKSSSTAVATIDENGCLTTLKNGTAKITATAADGRKAEVTIKVGKLAESIEITTKKGEPFTVASGKGLDLVSLVTYTDGTTDKKASWTLSDDSVAKISSSGKLTATKNLAEPTVVEVTAVSADGKAEASVTVEILPLSTGVEVYGPFSDSSSFDVDVSNTTQKWDMTTQGNTFYLYAGLFPYDAMQDVTWKSSSTKVLTIDENGKVTCLQPGSVTITATAKDGSGKKAAFKLTVSKTMAYLTLPETAMIGAGKNLTITKLDGFMQDENASNKVLTWTLTDLNGNAVSKNVATLDAKGVLKANKAVTSPVEVLVRAEATDGSGLWAECVVTIFPLTKAIALYSMDTRTGELSDITGKAVSVPVNDSCVILTDTTNVPGFDYSDDKTADEYLPNGSAWEITQSPKLRMEFDGQSICFYPTEQAREGDSIKVTLKALDGSGKTASFTIRVTEARTLRGKTIGISMPNSYGRWLQDSEHMANLLTDLGHTVIVTYADNTVDLQNSQVRDMVAEGIDCLLISCIDPYNMGNLLESVLAADVPVVAYDRLPWNTHAVSCFTTFDNIAAGRMMAEQLAEELDLANTEESYTIELFMGAAEDRNAALLYRGAMEVLTPYLENGTLVCKSGRTSFESSSIQYWSMDVAYDTCTSLLASYYSDEPMDICFTAYDGFAYACADALAAWGCSEAQWPIITGQDCELQAVKNILSGVQTMTIFKDTRLLAEQAAKILDDVVNGRTPDVNDTTTNHNGAFAVPSCLLDPQIVTAENYRELLIDTGYYTEEEIFG